MEAGSEAGSLTSGHIKKMKNPPKKRISRLVSRDWFDSRTLGVFTSGGDATGMIIHTFNLGVLKKCARLTASCLFPHSVTDSDISIGKRSCA